MNNQDENTPLINNFEIGIKEDIIIAENWIKNPKHYGLTILILIIIIGVIWLSIFLSKKYCINGNPKAKNGDCCSLGITLQKNVCYNTSCPTGVRNKYGHCCKSGLTTNDHYGNINCIMADAANSCVADNYSAFYEVCCLYGKTHFGNACNKYPCQNSIYQENSSPRTELNHTKCCLNGVAHNGLNCNDLKCTFKMASYSGNCCKYGPAKGNSKKCNDLKTRNGHRVWHHNKCTAFASSGTCCTNGLTGTANNGKYCNEKCKHEQLTKSGKCCKYGATKNNSKCFKSKCNHSYERNALGRCCGKEGRAINSQNCNNVCKTSKYQHTKNGACCAPSQQITECSKNII